MFRNILSQYNSNGTLQGKISHGIVIDNNDPSQLQRVKVRVAELHSGRPEGEIPWSLQFMFSKQGHTNSMGSIAIPVIGAEVLIMFPEDDEHNTYYIADYYSKNTQIAELLVDYPHVYGNIDASGNLFLVNTLKDTVTFVHVSGTFINIQQSGMVNVVANNTMNFFANGDINMRATGGVYIDGTVVHFNSQHSPMLLPTPRTKPSINPPVNDNY